MDALLSISQAVSVNKVLGYGTIFFIVLSIIIALILPFDNREVLGINLWIKPLKFTISIAIFLGTSIFILQPLSYSQPKLSIVSWVLLITMLVEIGCIVLQASRAQLSHFNITDSLGSVLFPLMGFAITITYLTYTLILFDYFRTSTGLSPEMVWAIRLGIIIFLFGGISGFMMVTGLKHSVGVADGGPGLPFTNWSTVGGDLRVSHFISLHAIQVLPLLAVALSQFPKFAFKPHTVILIAGCTYLLFAVLALVQAMNGKPFIRL